MAVTFHKHQDQPGITIKEVATHILQLLHTQTMELEDALLPLACAGTSARLTNLIQHF
jgi:hypothetical protein